MKTHRRNHSIFLRLSALTLIAFLSFANRTNAQLPATQPPAAQWALGLGLGGSFGVNEAATRPIGPMGRIYGLWERGFGNYIWPEIGVGIENNQGNYGSGVLEYNTTMIPFDLRLRLMPIPDASWSPYLYGGFGGVNWKVNTIPVNEASNAKNSGVTGYIPLGIGLYHDMNTTWAIELSAGGNISFSDDLNPIHDGKNDGWWHGMLGLVYKFGEDPHNMDSDGDGLSDWDEVHIYHTDPHNPDTDGDGLSDGDEVNKYHTDPLKADTDGDGLSDGDEVKKYHTDPLKKDTDGDGLTDGDEVNIYHTDPLKADTDGDGLSDGDEVNVYHTDPLKADTDGDGLSDGDEVRKYHTNPLLKDTDGGGVDDGTEVRRGTNPLDPSDDMPKKVVAPPAPVPNDELDLSKGGAITLEGIEFDVSKATIRPSSEVPLQKAFKTLQNHPELTVQIVGNTDNSGKRAVNMKLSQERADAVMKYLVDHGISATRMTAKGVGPDNPVAPNDTPDNKQKNRRIEFIKTN